MEMCQGSNYPDTHKKLAPTDSKAGRKSMPASATAKRAPASTSVASAPPSPSAAHNLLESFYQHPSLVPA